MDPDLIKQITDVTAWVIPLVLAVTMHEAAHGYVALKFGDDTALRMGRVSFNPFRHVDRFGTVIFPLLLMLMKSPILFGYAKPVPVNFARLNPQRLGSIMVALAGPAANLIQALAVGLLLHIDQIITPEQAPWLFLNLYRALLINVVLIVFNMLPVLPLDGGRVVAGLLPRRAQAIYGKMERYGVALVLLVLLAPTLLGIDVASPLVGTPAYYLLEKIMILTGNGG